MHERVEHREQNCCRLRDDGNTESLGSTFALARTLDRGWRGDIERRTTLREEIYVLGGFETTVLVTLVTIMLLQRADIVCVASRARVG